MRKLSSARVGEAEAELRWAKQVSKLAQDLRSGRRVAMPERITRCRKLRRRCLGPLKVVGEYALESGVDGSA